MGRRRCLALLVLQLGVVVERLALTEAGVGEGENTGGVSEQSESSEPAADDAETSLDKVAHQGEAVDDF